MENRPKDPILNFKSTKVGTSSTGKARLELGMTQEEAARLIAELTKLNGPNGVKIDIHTGKKTNSYTGLEFDSSFAFVKAIQERPAAGVKGFKPKEASGASATAQNVLRNAKAGN